MQIDEKDVVHLRRSFVLADEARKAGERPFGAVITDALGRVIAEGVCSSIERCDVTAHAEVSAIRMLWKNTDGRPPDGTTLFSSSEPCAMCAGAIYWAKIGRVVFGLGETRLRTLRNVATHTSALKIDCRAVLASGGYSTEVIGPVLEEEAIQAHVAFWTDKPTS